MFNTKCPNANLTYSKFFCSLKCYNKYLKMRKNNEK